MMQATVTPLKKQPISARYARHFEKTSKGNVSAGLTRIFAGVMIVASIFGSLYWIVG